MDAADPFPELPAEQQRLHYGRACRDEMIARFRSLDPSAAADEITKEYVQVTVAEAIEDLQMPGAGEFFGRISTEATHVHPAETFYIGRRHIEDARHEPVVVDWRAPVAAPFYRATHADPVGLTHRRRFTAADGRLTAYLDEQLDDPDAADAGSGVPDPVLAEIAAARSGAMREIVATIQAEQDHVIRAPLDQCLVVQGGPGTGKTAVGLHRAAFLLFEHRRRLGREGVLVVGPNRVFLDYIGNVLPSLGERSVRQATVLDLCVPKVPISADDPHHLAASKGSVEMLERLEQAVMAHVRPPVDDVRCPLGARTLVLSAHDVGEWVERARASTVPVNQRRTVLRSIVDQELRARTGEDGLLARLPDLRRVLGAAWPTRGAIAVVDRMLDGPRGKRRQWTPADQLLVDEANSLLDGTPFVFGHVVVDEAQDHSAVALRVIGRRSPSGSMTVLGDLAQSSTPAGQRSWDDAIALLGGPAAQVAHLTIGYRVPEPVLRVANRLLPFTGVITTAAQSVRLDGEAPHEVVTGDVGGEVARQVVILRRRHPLTGVVSPSPHHRAIAAALAGAGLTAVGHVQGLGPDEVAVFTPEQAKGLEFDGVVVVDPDHVMAEGERGARLLYVALTRAVQSVVVVSPAPSRLAEFIGHP